MVTACTVNEDSLYSHWRQSVQSLETVCTDNGDSLYSQWRQPVQSMETACTVNGDSLYSHWRQSVRTLCITGFLDVLSMMIEVEWTHVSVVA